MSLGQQLYPHLPFLRRYARALTGSQMHGDAYVRATLEAIVAAPEEFPADVDVRIGLYRTFGAIWSSTHLEDDLEVAADEDTQQALARARLARMTPLPRQALLLESDYPSFRDSVQIQLIGKHFSGRGMPEPVQVLNLHALAAKL